MEAKLYAVRVPVPYSLVFEGLLREGQRPVYSQVRIEAAPHSGQDGQGLPGRDRHHALRWLLHQK